MSRRGRHGHHAHSHAPGGRPVHHAPPASERPQAPSDGAVAKGPEPGVAAAIARQAVAAPPTPASPTAHPGPTVQPGPAGSETQAVPAQPAVEPSPAPAAIPEARIDAHDHVETPRNDMHGEVRIPVMEAGPAGMRTTCTSAQLRRFIKSRPWVPLHELRRRFGISGDDDDVSPIRVGHQLLFIGLPPAEARMVGELLSGGDVGYELSLDPTAPIVVGVYPMRPVPRG
jgi:hypothetical protein